MTKEEFKKLIDSIEFEQIESAAIVYYKKKPKKEYYDWEDQTDYEPKYFEIGNHSEKKIINVIVGEE